MKLQVTHRKGEIISIQKESENLGAFGNRNVEFYRHPEKKKRFIKSVTEGTGSCSRNNEKITISESKVPRTIIQIFNAQKISELKRLIRTGKFKHEITFFNPFTPVK